MAEQRLSGAEKKERLKGLLDQIPDDLLDTVIDSILDLAEDSGQTLLVLIARVLRRLLGIPDND